MNRDTFLKNLKEITDILETNNILYDVLFDYRNKQEFKNIKILVNDIVDDRTLCSLFGSIEKTKDKFLELNYNDISLIIVKADSNFWVNSFYYYSGEIISDALNKIANRMGMSYTDKGLYYIDTKTPILVTNKVFEIFNFFELKTNLLLEGFNNKRDIYEFIINSTYFNSSIFEISDIKENNFFYDEKIEYYKEFLDVIEPFNKSLEYQYTYENKENYIDLIDLYFPESNLLKKYSEQKVKQYLRK
jgi:hypothetical protein